MQLANFSGYLKDSAACGPMLNATVHVRASRLAVQTMPVRRQLFAAVVLSSATAALAGCAAPMGPIGGPELAGCFVTKCCLQHSNAVCDENDPSINPPHSNFHPLPTRPVFSPPPSLPGQYEPWPGPNLIPPPEAHLEPLEVENSRRPDDPPPPPSRLTSGHAADEQTAINSVSLRR